MNVLHIGDGAFLGREVAEAFAAAGHEVLAVPEASAVGRSERFDACVDTGSRTGARMRATLAALEGRVGHFVFVSSCEVYPAVPRLRPWRPEDVDLTDEAGLAGLDAHVRGLREAERELRIAGARGLAFTVLRPAWVEGADDPSNRTWWFVSRILDGGPVFLPDGDLPVYRHVSAEDVARAAACVADRSEAFGHTLNVVSDGVLNYWGHAVMLMDGVGRRVPVGYVPAHRWRAAGLGLPFGEGASSSYIDHSPLLDTLGWKPTSELVWVEGVGRALAKDPRPVDRRTRDREREVWAAHLASGEDRVEPGTKAPAPTGTKQWHLVGSPGEPASLRLDRVEKTPALRAPVLRLRRLALGSAVQRLLRGDAPSRWGGSRVLGHNALVEAVEAGASGLRNGATYVTCAQDEANGEPFVAGLDSDGFGAAVSTARADQLLEVPADLVPWALLADPLAVVLDALTPHLAANDGTIWVAGRSVEAALAGWLAADSGRPVVHVDRAPERDGPFAEFAVQDIGEAEGGAMRGRRARPTLVVDFSEANDVGRLLAVALADDGAFVGHRKPLNSRPKTTFDALPRAARTRGLLGDALAILRRWAAFRELDARLGPAVPPEAFWDVLLPAPFALASVETGARS